MSDWRLDFLIKDIKELKDRLDALQISDLKRKQDQRIRELDLKLNEQQAERLISINKHLIGKEVNVISFHHYGSERRHQGKLEYLAVGIDNNMSAFFKNVTIHGVTLIHEIK